MTKDETLQYLQDAKTAHMNWVQKAKLLIEGKEIAEESIPVNYTDCKFGKWFYSDAQKLNGLRNIPLDFMQKVEQLHIDLHLNFRT